MQTISNSFTEHKSTVLPPTGRLRNLSHDSTEKMHSNLVKPWRVSFRVIYERKSDRLFIVEIIRPPFHFIANILVKNADHRGNGGNSDKLRYKLLVHANNTVTKEVARSARYGMRDTDRNQRKGCKTATIPKKFNEKSTGRLVGYLPDVAIHADKCGPMRSPTSQRYRELSESYSGTAEIHKSIPAEAEKQNWTRL